ncbi:metallophosphoesterase family protein, partial [Listeria monocytogenes]|uniref:metallophosphoesterase family protein n=1 Tax=Listeria monocytogenes TaxID=1639 RepID=UPI0024983B18
METGAAFDQPEDLPLAPGDVLLSGHTHVAGISFNEQDVYLVNPGSVTFPRNGAEPSYALY